MNKASKTPHKRLSKNSNHRSNHNSSHKPSKSPKNEPFDTSKKLKVLMVLPALNLCGGIEKYVMSYYDKLHHLINFDFAVHEIKDPDYKTKIKKNGNNIFLFNKISLSNIRKNYRELDRFFKDHHDYDIVHCNMANAAFLYFKFAKKYNIKIRILHSHQNQYADKISHAIRNIPLIKLGIKRSTHFFACSKDAGDFLFKKKKYYIIKNGIDSHLFHFNAKTRQKIRKKLNLKPDTFLLGNVGRLCNQKNQLFLLDIFNEVLKQNPNSHLIIIGDGELKSKLEEKITALNISHNVSLLDPVPNINDYMQAFDIFILPSLYEGVGIVNIEAQASGLHIVISTHVPKEAVIAPALVDFLPLESSPHVWANLILKYNNNYPRNIIDSDLKSAGYDLNSSARIMLNIYKDILNDFTH